MRRLAAGLIGSVSMLLGSCTAWPPPGSGGFSEHREGVAEDVHHWPAPYQNWLQVRVDHDFLRVYLDYLVLRGARACLPAHVDEAEDRERLIGRELHGGLRIDAANEVIIQRQKLLELERRLDQVQASGACLVRGLDVQPPQYDRRPSAGAQG